MKKGGETKSSGIAPGATPVVPATASPAAWTFLTNHTHVLLCIYREPEIRLRDVAALVGITERMVQKVVAELVEAGYLTVAKQGRRNVYSISERLRLRHPLEAHHEIGELLALLAAPAGA